MLLRALRRGFAPVGLKTPWRFSHRRETSWRSVQIGIGARAICTLLMVPEEHPRGRAFASVGRPFFLLPVHRARRVRKLRGPSLRAVPRDFARGLAMTFIESPTNRGGYNCDSVRSVSKATRRSAQW